MEGSKQQAKAASCNFFANAEDNALFDVIIAHCRDRNRIRITSFKEDPSQSSTEGRQFDELSLILASNAHFYKQPIKLGGWIVDTHWLIGFLGDHDEDGREIMYFPKEDTIYIRDRYDPELHRMIMNEMTGKSHLNNWFPWMLLSCLNEAFNPFKKREVVTFALVGNGLSEFLRNLIRYSRLNPRIATILNEHLQNE